MRIFYMLGEMITPVFLLPIILAYYGRKKQYTAGKTVLCSLFSLYLASVFHLTGLPDLLYHRFAPNVYLIPFGEIMYDWKNALLNIALFVPLGFFLPVLGEKYRSIFKTLLFGLCMTVMVELLQMFTLRATDINDIITNVCGTGLGWLLWHLINGLHPLLRGENEGKDISFCCLATYFVMFFIQPFTYSFLWRLVFG